MTRVQPIQTLMVYDGADFIVTEGANFGDALSFADDIMLDDIYMLRQDAATKRLGMGSVTGQNHFTVLADTEYGVPGSALYLDCALTFMARDGRTFDALVFVEVDNNQVANIFFHPLAEMREGESYRLVGLDVAGASKRMAQVACVSFCRGTHITLSSGKQVKIEHLKPGDKVLTRTNGPQEIRWIGQTTVRAIGDFAPVVISKGTLNNENDLTLSPDHRLFIYQRSDTMGAGRAQVLVKARHLVDGIQVTQTQGGFVDYFQLLFDEHHIIYAEGIAAESFLMDNRTMAALPADLGSKMPKHEPTQHGKMELTDIPITESLAARLKAASAG